MKKVFEKCIQCDRLGVSCVPNLMLLPFPDLIKWCFKRKQYLGWTVHDLAEKSKVPEGTINRIKQGDYQDCKYSTIRNILLALIGGTTDEFPCNAQIEIELQQKDNLGKQSEKLCAVEKENEALRLRLEKIDEQHRADIRAVREEYREQIAFLKDELKSWRNMSHS